MKELSEFKILPPRDAFECARFDITDELLNTARIAAYMYGNQVTNDKNEDKPYNPKTFPEKAIDIIIQPKKDFIIELYFLSEEAVWDSKYRYEGRICKLGPDQMEQFFTSEFYARMLESIRRHWPLSDRKFMKMYGAVAAGKMKIQFTESDLADEIEEDGTWQDKINQVGKRVDLANKDITGDGKRDYTSTGRKVISFGDNGVKGGSGEFYCWPNPKYPFKWSQWKDWKKIKPLCKMKFVYNGRTYGISLSLFDENFDNRGFRAADYTWKPPLGWLTPGEAAEVMELSIVKKFARQCVKNIKKYTDMTAEEIYGRINNKDKITLEEIRKTLRVIKHVMNTALKNHQADTYCFETEQSKQK